MSTSRPCHLAALFALLALSAHAQDEAPAPAPAPAAAPDDAAAAAAARREAHLKALRETVVHFEFKRAPLTDITRALEVATGVPVKLGDAARRALERRRFRMKYVADRTGLQVLEDLARAAALDAEVTADGAVLDTRAQVRRLRERLGLPARPVRSDADAVARMLETKRLSLTAHDRPLEVVLDFLRDETGLRVVVLSDDDETAREPTPPRVTAQITDEPLKVVLDRVLAPAGWAWARQGAVVIVGPAEVIAARTADDEEPGDR